MNQNTEKTYMMNKATLMETIDYELMMFEQATPMYKRDRNFFDELENLTGLRNCLDSISVSENTLGILNSRGANVLSNLHDYWISTLDTRANDISRESKIYDTVIEWLSRISADVEKSFSNNADVQVQSITPQKQLYQKAWQEYQAYIERQSIKAPFDIIGSANVIADYALIMNAIEEGRFSSTVALTLLALDNPLETIYEAYQELDISITQEEMLDEAIQTVADEHNDTLTADDYDSENMNEDDLKTLIEGLRLDDQTLTYSEVELTANGQTTSFLTGGIPDTYSIDDIEQYREFVEDLPPLTEITVAVNSWCVGRGESEAADDDELAVIEENQDLLEQRYGIDPLQSDRFTEIAPDNSLDFDEEPDEGLEP